jgi:hypothetical protein
MTASVRTQRRLPLTAAGRVARIGLVIALIAATAGQPPPPVAPGQPVDLAVAQTPSAPMNPVLVGAGDIALCTSTMDSATAKLLAGVRGTVFTAGDNAYPDGTSQQFANCYDPTWGQFKTRTRPSPGNHEYYTAGASGYFDYFGVRAGPGERGWYAYDKGSWRIYSLNSNCDVVSCASDSPQLRWLRADLANHPRRCVLAYWHHPLFSSGQHGNDPAIRPFWLALYRAGADVVVNGHDHDYERFARQDPRGRFARDGIREFIVGTGGAELRPFDGRKPNSVARNATTHGVLKLTLYPGSFRWRFLPVAGKTFTDTGWAPCA